MANCAVIVLIVSVFFAAALGASPPSVSKRYRPDYQYNERTDAFYKLHIEARRGDQIKSVCAVEGASLMVPATHEDIAQVHGMFKPYPDLGNYVWVASDERESHASAEESAIINLPQETTNDDSVLSEPDEQIPDGYNIMYKQMFLHHNELVKHRALFKESKEMCSVLSRDGKIEDEACNMYRPFVCKVDAKDAPYNPLCDVVASDYHYNATVGSCYSIRRWVASWNEAYAECRKEGAHLVVLNSEAEMAVVRALMQATPRVGDGWSSLFYFAGFRADEPVGSETAVFRTIFNETLSEAGYESWSLGEPNNTEGEYCGTLFVIDGKLNDTKCRDLFAFICEKEVAAQS